MLSTTLMLTLALAAAVGLAVWGLIVTHRISGPLYIVARYLGVLGSGRYPDMRLQADPQRPVGASLAGAEEQVDGQVNGGGGLHWRHPRSKL